MTGKGVKAMYLECKSYPASEILEYVGAKGNDAAKKKLNRYGVVCFVNGWGKNANFNIVDIPDPFKLYCVFSMGFDPHSDFVKLRNYLFFLLGEDEYCWLPDEPMEEYLKSKGFKITRQTITKYRKRLEDLGYYHSGDFIYYRVEEDERGQQHHKQVEKEQYNYAWHLYWDKINNEGWNSGAAFAYMKKAFGGVPRKQAKPEKNGLYNAELNYLLGLVSSSFEN